MYLKSEIMGAKMDKRIVLITSNKTVALSAERSMRKLGVKFPIYKDVYSFNELLIIAEKYIEKGAKIIICRGQTAAWLRAAYDIHVVDIRYTFNDYAMVMQKLGQNAGKVAVVGFVELCKIAKINNMFSDVMVCELKNEDELEDTLRYLKSLGVNTVIGSVRTKNLAKSFGMKGACIEVDDVSIEQTIQEALHNLKILVELEKKNEIINSVLNSVSEGIISIDQDGRITNVNPFAKKMLGFSGNRWFKESIENVLPEVECIKAARQGLVITGEITTINGSCVTISSKPIDCRQHGENLGVVFTIQGAEQIQTLESKFRKSLLGKGHVAKARFADILGKSPQIKKTMEMAKEFALVDSSVLILGETGVGKEIFAQSIHNHSRRWQKPFIAINCAAFPTELLESELFGYVKGSFTGANPQGKMGVFELAHTGSILLDEIGEMPFLLQAKLLRVLQEKEVVRLGDDKVIPIDVRVLSATNKNLKDEINRGRFREDLYYRLCVLSLTIPPLRMRKEDIYELSQAFITRYNEEFCKNIQGLTTEAYDMLMSMDWTGNIRQLRNFIERSVVLCKGDVIDAEIIQNSLDEEEKSQGTSAITNKRINDAGLISEIEKDLIKKLMIETKGDKYEVAKRLGISPTTLWRRMKKFGNE